MSVESPHAWRSRVDLIECLHANPPGNVRRCGRAETRDGDEHSGNDPRGLQPARAVRRALAGGGIKAADVGAVWACFDRHAFPDASARARAALELAFGRYSARVVIDVRPALENAALSASLAEIRCARAVAGSAELRAAMAVSIGVDGRNRATVFCAA